MSEVTPEQLVPKVTWTTSYEHSDSSPRVPGVEAGSANGTSEHFDGTHKPEMAWYDPNDPVSVQKALKGAQGHCVMYVQFQVKYKG